MRLTHFTCSHGAKGILRDKAIHPKPHPLLTVPLVWMTDAPALDRDALGLTSAIITCDRMEWAFSVDAEPVSFLDWIAANVDDRALRAAVVRKLIAPPGTLIRHWYVAEADVVPVEVLRYPESALAT